MKKEDLKKLMSGKPVKVGNKSQITLVESSNGLNFLLEKFEFTNHNGTDMYSCYESYKHIEDAIDFGNRMSSTRRDYSEYDNENFKKYLMRD